MAVFTFEALDTRQRPQRGTIAADTPALARQSLRQQGLAVTRIESAAKSPASALRWRPVLRRREATAEVWRHAAMLLRAGLTLEAALEVCLRQSRGGRVHLLRQVLDGIRAGQSLSDALAPHAAALDPLALPMLRVGEQAGTLGETLEALAAHEERVGAARQKLGTALIYPLLVSGVAVAVTTFLMTYVVPQLIEVLQDAGRELPWPTRLLKTGSDALLRHGLWIAAALLILVGLLGALARTETGRRRSEHLLLRLPVLGDLLRKVWAGRVSMMLAALLRSDVRFIEALRTVRAHVPQRLYRDALGRVEQAIEAGASIAAALPNDGLVPPLMVQLLAIGQESGELPRTLEQLRDGYEKEAQLAQARFLAVLEPALIVGLAAVIGFVVLATLLPILETTRIAGA